MGLYNEKETVAFNLALPYLTRVNAILNSNYVEFKNDHPQMFALNLRQLYRELCPWLKENEKEIFAKLFDELATIPKRKKEVIWNKLEEIEMEMRGYFRELGMLMPKVTDPRFLFQKQR